MSNFRINIVGNFCIICGFVVAALFFMVLRFFHRIEVFSFILLVFVSIFNRIRTRQLIDNMQYVRALKGILLAVGFAYSVVIISTFFEVRAWDFPSFYLFSKAGLHGGNFYDPGLFGMLYEDLVSLKGVVTSEFLTEVVRVGFVYPPPSMLLFYPIAVLDFEESYFLWQLILTLIWILDWILALSIVISKFKKNDLPSYFVYTSILTIFLFPGVHMTLIYSQTNVVMLLFVFLIIKNIESRYNGIFLVLMVVIKPIALIFFLYFLLHRKWKVLLYAFISGCVLLLITGITFGFEIFYHYLTSLPTERIPEFVYSEHVNKSLNAVLLRVREEYFSEISLSIFKFAYLSFSIVISMWVLHVSYMFRKTNTLTSFLIFIPLSLIIYPGTLVHYAILLLPLIIIILITFAQVYRIQFLLIIFTILYLLLTVSLFIFNIGLIILLSFVAMRPEMFYSKQFKVDEV